MFQVAVHTFSKRIFHDPMHLTGLDSQLPATKLLLKHTEV